MSIKEIFAPTRFITIIITIVGIVASVVTIYAFFFYEGKSNLQYEVITDTSVLDIKADLGNLDIFYGKSNLKETKENLRIINIRVVNTGNVNILKDFYDDEDLLGLRITDGNIIEIPELLQYSNDYLRNNVKVHLVSPTTIRFSKFIIEPKEYFVVKLLVLHKAETSPGIIPIGKIAGIKSIKVINTIESKTNKAFFSEVFSGGILVQTVRLFLYTIAAVIILLAIIFASVGIAYLITRIRRNKIVCEFRKLEGYSFSNMDNAIFSRFRKEGSSELTSMPELLANANTLSRSYTGLLEAEKKDLKRKRRRMGYGSRAQLRNIRHLIEDGLVVKKDDQLIINEPMKDTLEKFVNFLRKKNALDGLDPAEARKAALMEEAYEAEMVNRHGMAAAGVEASKDRVSKTEPQK